MKTMLKRVALGAVAAVLANSFAVADTPEDVTVTASRLTNAKVVVSHEQDWFYKDIALSTSVNAAGLDLSTSAGAAGFEKRIDDAALAACKEITRFYPTATPDEATCAKAAAAGAISKAHKLEAKAKSAPK